MTLRARRIYYSLAILVFFVVAPLVIATAAGWRWSGWRQGFIGTGTLIVTANPKAAVFLNGKNIGTTPKRIGGLEPGQYRLSLRRDGWQSWDHIVRVDRGVNSTIGPVRLFRNVLPRSVVNTTSFDNFIVSPDQRAIAGWSPTDTGATLQLLWPLTGTSIALPSNPTWIAVSRNQRRLAVGLAESTNVYSTTNRTLPWIIPAGPPVFWLDSSESIFFRLEDSELIAYDLLLQKKTALQSAQSAVGGGQMIWLSRTVGQVSSLEQRTNTLAASSTSLATLPGVWTVLQGYSRGVFATSDADAQGFLFTINRLSGRLEEIPLGHITSVFPEQTPPYPLWLNGVDLLTLSIENEPTVLLRSPVTSFDVDWIDRGDILALIDVGGFSIRSVSAQQGRGTLIERAWVADETPLLIDVPSQSVLFSADHRLQRLRWD